MVDHDKEGAFGLVINKTTDQSLSELIKNFPVGIHKDKLVFCGGPVDPMFVSVIHDKKDASDPGVEIIPGLYMARSYDTLLEILKSESTRFRVFQGYAGWGAGQLEAEFQRLSWVAMPADTQKVFSDREMEEAWKGALVEKGGLYRYFVEHTKDPMLN